MIARVLCLLLLFTAPLAAAEDKPQADTHLAAAVNLLEAMNAKANMTLIVDTLIPIVMGQICQQHPGSDAAALQAFQSAFREEMVSSLDDLMQLSAKVYVEHFSEQELNTLTNFYRTDVGKKYIAEIPAITKETAPLGVVWGQRVAGRAVQRALERLQKNGVNL